MTVEGRAGGGAADEAPVDDDRSTVPGHRAASGGRRAAGERTSRVVARTVTYAMVAGLLLVAVAEVEEWPVTSFRLFSQVRTDRSFGLELTAVAPDGRRERVRLSGGSQVVANAGHQLQQLRSDPPAARRTKVLAWLDLVGMDAARFEKVELERVERRLDPDGGPPTEVRRSVVAEVEL